MAKIFVGVPVFNLQDPFIKDNQAALISSSKHEILFSQIIGANVEQGRQMLIDSFLKTDCTHYFTMDADIITLEGLENAIDRLISLDKDIVGGIYVYKRKQGLPVFRPIDLQDAYEKDGKFPDGYKFVVPKEPFQIRWMGNGFKMARRNVVEAIKAKHICPNLPMIHMDEYVSEDWAFDQRARELGFEVWADPTIKLAHRGTYDYTLEDFYGKH